MLRSTGKYCLSYRHNLPVGNSCRMSLSVELIGSVCEAVDSGISCRFSWSGPLFRIRFLFLAGFDEFCLSNRQILPV